MVTLSLDLGAEIMRELESSGRGAEIRYPGKGPLREKGEI
jgi:hypothetical protein